MKIRVFSEEKANEQYYKGKGLATWNNPRFYEYIEVPDDMDVEIMLEAEGYNTLQEFMDSENKEHFNSWRRAQRHLGGKADEILENIPDNKDFEETIIERIDDEALIDNIHIVLSNHPEWADLVIEIDINEMTIRQYAKKVGKDESGVGKMLKRAHEYLKKYLLKVSD